MGFRAQSLTLKHRLKQAEKAIQLELAVQAYRKEQEKAPKLRDGLRIVASRFPGVAYKTLWRRTKGMRTIQELNESKMKIPPAMEEVMVQLIETSSDWSNPLTNKAIAKYANEIGVRCFGPDFELVGVNWVGRFVERHRDRVQTYWSKPLDTQRAQSLNPEAVQHWFELVKREIVDPKILPKNIYGMDESGFPPSNQGTSRVVGRRGNKVQHKQGSSNRENATGIIAICADGTVIKPLIIFKSEHLITQWFENNVADAAFAKSPKGWTDMDIALEWLTKIFNPETEEKAVGQTRVLVMDGHNSHFSLAFLQFCVAHNIVVICYPAHCTHALQGLDVVCFAKMKRIWHEELDAHYQITRKHVTKLTYAKVFGTAFLKAFSKDTILAAFRATGVYPFDSNVISEKQMKPSEVTSTRTTFPLPFTSPVRRIMAVFHHQPATTLEQDPVTYQAASTSLPMGANVTVLSSDDRNSDEQASTPTSNPHTPSRTRTRAPDAAIDPDLYTPSKRARICKATLAVSQSGSYLVSRARVDSSRKPISPVIERAPYMPQPDWTMAFAPGKSTAESSVVSLQKENDLLRANLDLAYAQMTAVNSINEGCNAQLVIQHVLGDKMNAALYEKEKHATSKKREKIGADGKGVVYTSADVMEAKERIEKDSQEREANKLSKLAFKAAKREAVDRVSREWEQIKRDHVEGMSVYRARVAELKGQKVPQRLWPKAPVKPKKPNLPLVFQAKKRAPIASAVEGDQEQSDSENDEEGDSDLDRA